MDMRLRASRHIAAAFLLIGTLASSVPAVASALHVGTRVSDAGLADNSILNGNTSRNLAVAADGTVYAVFQGPSGIRVARSSNRGQSFEPSVQVSAASFESEIAVSTTGIVYVAWSDDLGHAQVSRSLDGAQSFSAAVDAGPVIGTVHMATDSNWVYLIDRSGNTFLRSGDNGLTFSEVAIGAAQVFSDVHVDPDNGDVFLLMDNPTIKYFVSTDQGATFGPETHPIQGGDIFYSVAGLSVGPAGRFLIVSGGPLDPTFPTSAALRVDVDANTSEPLAFGTNSVSQGRSIEADRCGNVVDGYVDGTGLKFHVSNDLGDTFGAETTIASVPDPADQSSNVFIDQTTGNVLFLYTQSGEVFLNAYKDELSCYKPQLSASALAFSAQFVGTTSGAQVVSLTNSDVSAIEITDVATSGDFADAGQCVGSLAPGASCDISVTFSPSATGTRNGQVEVSTNIFAQPRIVKLTGLGVDTAPAPQFSPGSVDFATRVVDTTSDVTVMLSNSGNRDLTINGFNISGAFAVTHACPATLAPGDSCDVHISFSPNGVGTFSGTLRLDSNAPGAPAAVALSGAGATGHEITVGVAEGAGTILPGSALVVEGETQSFTVTPTTGYVISSVTGCGGSLSGDTFTTAPITAACSITATFAVVVTAHGKGGGGSLNFFTLGGLLFTLILRCMRRFRPSLAMLLALPGLAQADDSNHWYAGLDIGNARTDVTSADLSTQLRDRGYDVVATVRDRSRTAWGIHGGWRFSPHFATQFGYTDLGTVDTEFSGSALDLTRFLQDANRIQPRSASGYDINVVGSYPLGRRFSITAQLGGFEWSADYRVQNSGRGSVKRGDHGFDLTFGAGLEFELRSRTALTAGWTRHEIDRESVDLVALGLQYRWP